MKRTLVLTAAAMLLAGTLGFLAAGLVLLQIIQLLFCFPLQRQIDAMNRFLPELSDLSSKADAVWLKYEYVRRSTEGENMWGLEQVSFLRDRLNEIELQYTNGICFPQFNTIRRKAEKRQDAFVNSKYAQS